LGLTTARGSGTNGYVQRNLSSLRVGPRRDFRTEDFSSDARGPPAVRKPNQEILEHDRKRAVEVKCIELQARLEDEGLLPEAEIAYRVDELRKELSVDLNKMLRDVKGIKEHEAHQLAAAKEKANERVKNAFGLGSNFVEGASFDRELQVRLGS
ncbi:cwf21 domain-containing protein, partial [Blyttiomyces helicus]